MPVGRTRYRFGLFEADPQDGRVFRQGVPVRLQDQPFQVLVALLERHGDVVTRDELRQRLWPGDTFVEFDKSLGVALTKLRAALGDEAANPRFIETLPKRGYRFIAPVSVETTTDSSIASPASLALPSPSAPSRPIDALPSVPLAPPEPSPAPASLDRMGSAVRTSFAHRGRTTALAALGLVALALIGLATWRYTRPRPAPPASRVSIVVSEFRNDTGDTVFVGSLRRAALVGLRQSPFFSIMADATIADTLQTLGRAPNDTLTAPLARDVCMHAHGTALVDGGISLAGDTYTLDVEASRCADGVAIARDVQTFTNKNDALPALGRAIEHLRPALGESHESLDAYDVPLQVATTDSIEALRAFHLGMDLRLRADNLHAIPALRTAIALDPHFALAYAQLGSAYSNTGNEADGLQFFVKAFDLRDRTTEPERLYITGRYFDIVTREMEKAIENYRLWTGLYPDEWGPFNALANDANLIGRYDVAALAASRGAALAPRQLFPRVNLMTAYSSLDRFEDAAAVAREILAQTPDNSSGHVGLYSLARHAGDDAAAAREVAWGAKHADASMIYVEGEDAGWHGRFGDMTRLFRDSARMERDAGSGESAGDTLAFSAVMNSLAGRSEAALADASSAAALGHNEIILGSVGVVWAREGRTTAAQQSLDDMSRTYPLSTYTLGMYAPMVRGALLAQGSPSAADVTSATSAGLPYELGQNGSLELPYLRGLAYLRAHAPELAIVEFQKILDHVGVDPVSPIQAMSELGVARADAAMGQRDDSRKAYEALRALWANADRDAPIVRAVLGESASGPGR